MTVPTDLSAGEGMPTTPLLRSPEALRSRLELVAGLLAAAPAALTGARLLWRDSAGLVRSHALTDGAVAGRDRRCELALADARLSRRHCSFHRSVDGGWSVEDLGSTNRTVVNRCPVTRVELRDGDVLTLGATDFVFLR